MSIVSTFKELYKQQSVKSVGVYTFTNFFGKAASFLLLFVFTNPIYISPSENGLLSLFSSSLLFLMPFLSLGIIQSTSSDFFKMQKNEFRDFFTTGFVMPLILTALSVVLLFIFREKLKQQFGFPYIFTWLIPMIIFLTFCYEQFLSLARNSNETGIFLKANIAKIILELGVSFVLVVFVSWRWKGRIAGILISYLFISIYAIFFFIKKDFLFGKIKKKYIVSELVYAIPIIAMQASSFCMNSSDKFFLCSFMRDNNQTVGVYSIACVFASVLIVFCTALLQYIFPKIFSILSVNSDYFQIRKIFWVYIRLMCLALVVLVCLTPLAYHFINSKYHAALSYIYLIYVGYFLWAVSYFFYSFLLYFKQKRKLLGLSLLSIAISLVLNYFMIKYFGAFGGAVAVVSTYFMVLILTLIFTKPYWKKLLVSKG
jgi:O-antigen/teichoic acid export membrane protein